MTGAGTAAERGFPDVGLLTMTEMVTNAKYIANAVDIPVICDSDSGFGNPLNVIRAVQEYEAAGVAAIHIEDQVFPKKCGFFEGKQVIPLDDHVNKIRAALDAHTDPDFVIIARCDAYAVTGWEDTIRRSRAYIEAGADVVFVDGIKSQEDIQNYARDMADLPRMYNGDLMNTNDLNDLGYKITICGSTIWLIFQQVKDSFEELKATGRRRPQPFRHPLGRGLPAGPQRDLRTGAKVRRQRQPSPLTSDLPPDSKLQPRDKKRSGCPPAGGTTGPFSPYTV